MNMDKSFIIDKYFKEIEKQFSCFKRLELLGTNYTFSKEKGIGEILRIHINNKLEVGIFDILSECKYSIKNKNEMDLLIVSYCLEGNKEISFGKKYCIKKGDIKFLRQSKASREINHKFSKYRSICLFIDLKYFENILIRSEDCFLDWKNSVDLICKQDHIVIEKAPTYINEMVKGIKHINPKSIIDYIRINELVLNCFTSIFRFKLNKRCLFKCANEEDYLCKAKKIIINNLENQLSIKDLAEKLNTNTYKLQKRIKETKGTTTYDFIRKTKIEYSKNLLEETSLPIICIAQSIGYENPSKYSSAFKKITGLTPTGYRNKFKEDVKF